MIIALRSTDHDLTFGFLRLLLTTPPPLSVCVSLRVSFSFSSLSSPLHFLLLLLPTRGYAVLQTFALFFCFAFSSICRAAIKTTRGNFNSNGDQVQPCSDQKKVETKSRRKQFKSKSKIHEYINGLLCNNIQ